MYFANKVMAKVMAKDTTEELAATQDAMLKADMAIINAIQVATEANLEAVKAIQVATEASRALHNELNKIKQKTTKVIGEAIGEAVREANKPIEKAIRNFREANRNFREAERKAKDVPEVPEKSLNDLLNALLID